MQTEMRSALCGTLRAEHSGQHVTLVGWVQNVRALGNQLFLTLRDHSGLMQLTFLGDGPAATLAKQVHPESVVQVSGSVRLRPEGMAKAEMLTGDVEVVVERAAVLNPATPSLPMPVNVAAQSVREARRVTEEVRLAHRHLDLRSFAMQRALRLRAAVASAVRSSLEAQGFVEVETPLLFKSTPEGAREFLVPTRAPARFFALPQSPQQYKQLLMVGGVDRYYQIARCFRDESGRADRQPEFTQVDLEMAFVSTRDVQTVVERTVAAAWRAAVAATTPVPAGRGAVPLGVDCTRLPQLGLQELSPPFPRLSFQDAMRRFGSDKPDVRFGMEFADVTDALSEGVHAVCSIARGGGSALALRVPALSRLSRRELTELVEAGGGPSRVSTLRVTDTDALQGPLAAALPPAAAARLLHATQARRGDVLFVAAAAGGAAAAGAALGAVRLAAAAALEARGETVRGAGHAALWVEDFPLFEEDEERGGLRATHHPFTAPHWEDEVVLRALCQEIQPGAELTGTQKRELLRIRGQHYDLVCNGSELGGGSIRIHSAELQRDVMARVLRLPDEQVQGFAHLLAALAHGAPPHGGLALGFDRVLAVMCGASSIRDVIAFPKASSGRDPLTGAPSEATAEQLREYFIQVVAAQQ